MGGEKPNLADLAVYGALSAIEGCDAFKDLGEKTKVMPWFEAMKQAVKESEGKDILSFLNFLDPESSTGNLVQLLIQKSQFHIHEIGLKKPESSEQ